MRTFMTALAVAAVATFSTACASKKYVKTSVGEVNDKVDSLGRSVEQTQERTRQNEAKIGEVDAKATAAGNSAQQANAAAANANTAASAANANATGVDKQSKRRVLEVVINTASSGFETMKAELPDDAKGQIDQVIARLQQDPKNVWIEIEGHTDNTGPAELNEKLGLERADAAKRYLYEKHQIPLHKINVISYGMTKPIGDNKTKEGRAENRRIVIRVLG